MDLSMQECNGQAGGFLPGGLTEKFPQIPAIRQSALALDLYIRNGKRADAVTALENCGLSSEVTDLMLQQADRGRTHG